MLDCNPARNPPERETKPSPNPMPIPPHGQAARKVSVVYEELPAITSLSAALAAESFFDFDHTIKHGPCVEEALATPGAVTVEGEMRMGGQVKAVRWGFRG